MIHSGAACSFTRQRAEESNDFDETHCDVPFRKRPYEIVVHGRKFLGVIFFGMFNVDTSTLCMGESNKTS